MAHLCEVSIMKKYSSTPRFICLIVFAILTAGFGFLAVYFTFLIAPFVTKIPNAIIEMDYDIAFGLYAMLGSLGIAGTFVSLLGLFRSIKAIRKEDDESTRRCFDGLFSLGYVVAMALFANAGWLILLTTKNFGNVSIGFVVAVYVIALILVLVGTNIPLVKVYEDDDEGVGMARILLTASLAVGLAVGVTMLYSGFVNLIGNSGSSNKASVYILKFFLLAIAPVLGCVLAAIGLRAHKKGNGKAGSLCLYSSLGLYGLGMLAAGALLSVTDNVKSWNNTGSLMENKFAAESVVTNSVLSYVFGGLVLVAAIVLICMTLKPKKSAK